MLIEPPTPIPNYELQKPMNGSHRKLFYGHYLARKKAWKM